MSTLKYNVSLKKEKSIILQIYRCMQRCRPLNYYQVKYLDYTYFQDFKTLKYYSSIRPDQCRGDLTINDIKCLQYSEYEFIKFKIN